MTASDNWDPSPTLRTWYSHVTTGDRGYLVRRNGKDAVRLDRGPTVEIIKPLNKEWQPDEERRPISRGALARVAYVAHQAFCRALGEHEAARTEWESLSDQERQCWLDGTGPDGPIDETVRLYQLIWRLFSGMAS